MEAKELNSRPRFAVRQTEGSEVIDLEAWAKRYAALALQLEGWRVSQTPQAA